MIPVCLKQVHCERVAVLLRWLPLLGLVAACASASQGADEKDPVKVTLVVILASEDGDTIDPQLKAIAAEVRKTNPKLKSFTLKSMQGLTGNPVWRN